MTASISCLAQSEGKAYCDAYLRNVCKTEKITGMSVAIEQSGKLLYEFADSDGKDKKFSKDTPLHVASITKIMTSTLLIRLMEDGKLSVYDNVQKFIPEFPVNDVMVLHLMTHTSGLRATKGYNPANKLPFYSGLERRVPVDMEFEYFSTGYNILADIVERLSGAPLEDYAKRIIFDPLEMKHTTLAPHIGESGMHTTAEDLLKFSRHILDIRKTGKAGILKPCSVDLMFREMTRGRYDRTTAFFLKSQTRRFGRYFGDLNSPEAAGHAGATGCFLLLDPKYDLSIVILTNGSKTIQAEDENFVRINNLLMGQFAK
jgi:CubicO group peptidase (beta-lactamase class C family)